MCFFFFKQKTAYEMRISDWSSDVCSSDLVVVDGTAEVTREDEVFRLRQSESTFIAPGQRHRLANHGPAPLKIIEVQCGDLLEEEDIMRLEENYGRRSEERRVGQACVSTGRSRWSRAP